MNLLQIIIICTLVFTCFGCIERERQALLNFKHGFPANNDTEEGLLPSWTAGDRDCCRWEGVECNETTSQVVSLAVSGLRGSLPHNLSLQHLVSLQSLDLSFNELQGPVPASLGALCNLRKLDLSWNSFNQSIQEILHGISSGCTRVYLEVLDMSYNHLTGFLPDVSTFPRLKSLNLENNQLHGFSSDSFGPNSDLLVLNLGSNTLTGALPESVGQMSKLRVLMVPSNSLVGVISPAHFSNLSNLQVLDLSNNSLSFNLSSDFVYPSQLVSINLRSCNLGPKFPSWLVGQTNYSHLDISNSGISDFIPTWFWNFSSNLRYLNLSFNGFNEEIPNRKYRFRYPPAFDLSYNSFYGPIPQFLSNTTVLKLSTNKFSGNLSFLCTIKSSLMTYLDLSDNSLSGLLPDCWRGFKGLQILKLEYNNFSGRIPSSIGLLDQIMSLTLRNNTLSGELPRSLRNCVALKVLDLGDNNLSGFIPSWIHKLTELIVLILKSNGFHGDIPCRLCNVQYLQIIDLSMNNFSGVIPSCLTNWSSMVEMKITSQTHLSLKFSYTYFDMLVDENGAYEDEVGSVYFDDISVIWKKREHEYHKTVLLLKAIDLSSNKLSGEIPRNLTALLGMNTLNLSMNMLNGSIPSEIGQLQLLESLDLSENQLSGQIPSSMATLSYLSVLDLSRNNLSGKIPSSTQLQSFGSAAYMGNLQLCGAPLKTCLWERSAESPNAVSTGKDNSTEGEGWSESLWFYFGMAIGLIVGFVGVLATLLSSKYLRQMYFRVLENITDWTLLTIALNHARLTRWLQS